MALIERLKKGWNAFNEEQEPVPFQSYGGMINLGTSDRFHSRFTNEKSIVASIYTRIGIDASAVDIWHVVNDENGRFKSTKDSYLHSCLTERANIDQAARAFRLDMILSLCDKGVIAIVPVDTSVDPTKSGGFDVHSLRVGEITEWYPRHVRVLVYNDRTGSKEEVTLPKSMVGIVENPLSPIMNDYNSILQRLIRKLHLLDMVDEQTSSGKLDIIIQLPYTIRTDKRKEEAEKRRRDIEFQLKGSKYGIAYADATERITQLNRPAENNLLGQIQYLTNQLYSQLGVSEALLSGTADEATMLNYTNRTIEPIVQAIVEEINTKFLTKTARTQGQKIAYHNDPFKLVPVANIAEIADKFTRNEILSSNELRGLIGFKPVDDPKADMLINSNVTQPAEQVVPDTNKEDKKLSLEKDQSEGARQNEA